MKLLKKLKALRLLWKVKSAKIKYTQISKESSTAELLAAGEDLTLLIEFIKPSNIFLGVERNTFRKLEFQEVCDILALYTEGELLEIIEIITKEKKLKILESNSQEFIKFVKWINEEVRIIGLLYKQLEATELDEDDIAFQNAGADKLNRYKEQTVYYGISKNPADWPAIAKVPFEVMFTKLLMDRDYSAVNKQYFKNLKSKTK